METQLLTGTNEFPGIGVVTTSASSQSLAQLNEDYTKFLTLLTAQISNQDPLSPMDSTQFVAQLAQLSQVEQSVQTNSNLETLTDQINALATISGADMINRSTTVSSDKILLENGQGKSFFQLGANATDVQAEIRDPFGRVVRTIEGLSGDASREIEINWDGRDDSWQVAIDGTYTVSVSAKDAVGNPVSVFTYRNANVKEVLFHQGQLFYDIGGNEVVSNDAILAIR